MIKWLLAIALCLSFGADAREGFKVGADGTKYFTYWGREAIYQFDQSSVECEIEKKIDSVDDFGDAFTAYGFTCGKHLYIVVKEYMDTGSVLLITFDPDKWDDRKVYKADMFLRYGDEANK